jgi:hypothetical protein
MDGVTEEVTGVILDTLGVTRDIGDQDGVIRDGDTQVTDLITDIITTLTAMEEEVQLLITADETMLLTETSLPTEVIAVTEITPTETTLQTEEVIQQTETDILTLEEVLQTEELTILQAHLLQTEEVLPKDKAIATITLTEDQAVIQQQEITIAVITAHQQEATLLAHHVL